MIYKYDQLFDIQSYNDYGCGLWAQEKYLVHGYDDILWTSNLDDAMQFLKTSIETYETKKGKLI